MRLSQKRTTALYEALCSPINDVRAMVRKYDPEADEVDRRLCDAEILIWRRICKALNLTEELP